MKGKMKDYQGERKSQEAKEQTTGSRRKIKGVDSAKGEKCMGEKCQGENGGLRREVKGENKRCRLKMHEGDNNIRRMERLWFSKKKKLK